MSEIVKFAVTNGRAVPVEVDNTGFFEESMNSGIGPAGRVSRDRNMPMSFTEHLKDVSAAATAALDAFRESLSPDEVKLTFGVKLTAEAGAVIARTAFEGNLGVELVWRREVEPDDLDS